MRRHSETLKLVIGIVGGMLFIYGFYAYNDLHSRFKKTEENNDKLQQLHESLSSQLQVVYEHKTRLEKSLQQEKLEYSKARDEWEVDRTELLAKQKQLVGRIDTINKDLGMLKGRHEDLETDYSKLQEEHRKLIEDHRILTDQHDDEYRQYKVDCENLMAKLKDQVADQGRRLEDCRSQVSDLKRQPQQPAAPSARKQPRHVVDDDLNNNHIPNMAPAGGNGHIKNKQFNADGDDNRPQDAPRDQAPDQNSDNRVERVVHESNNQQEHAKVLDNIMQVPQPRQNEDIDHAVNGRQLNLRRAGVVADDHEIKHQVAAPRVVDDQAADAGDALKVKDSNGPDHGALKPPAAAAGDSDAGNRGNHPAGGALQPDNNNGFAVVAPDVQDNIGRVGGAGNHADPFAAGGQGHQAQGQGQVNDEEERQKQAVNDKDDAPRHQQLQQDNEVVARNQALQPPPAAKADADQHDDGDDNDDNGDVEDNAHVGARPVNPPEAIGHQLKRKEDVDGNYQEDEDAGGDNH